MMIKGKEVYNEVCEASGCNVTATKRIIFPLGFSACFCDKCAHELIRSGMGVEYAYRDCAEQDAEQSTIYRMISLEEEA